jgi:uncharacterized protein (TIGR03083 family)
MGDVRQLVDDLGAEQEVLDGLVAGLPEDRWATPTPSPGWTVADQVGHLTYFDGTAALAITDPDAFAASLRELLAQGETGGTTSPSSATCGRPSCSTAGAPTVAGSPRWPPASATATACRGTARPWARSPS